MPIISKLPGKQGEALWMKVAMGMTEREISELMDCPIGTVRGRVGRAMSKLRQEPKLRQIKRLFFGEDIERPGLGPKGRLGETVP